MHLLKFNKVQFVCYAFSKIAGLTKYHELAYFQGFLKSMKKKFYWRRRWKGGDDKDIVHIHLEKGREVWGAAIY